ncbi:MAG: RC-LH1 core complex protein PufX [Pseudomonadota bacterium]
MAETDAKPQAMRRDIFKQMLIGAAAAAGTVIIPVVFIYGLYLAGTLLPPESKEAVDPTPDSFGLEEE